MSNGPNKVALKTSGPPRPLKPGETFPSKTYSGVMSFDLTWSWGAQPANCIIEYAGDPIAQNACLQLEIGGHTFYGLCKRQVQTRAARGRTSVLEFVDMRELLHWDVVQGFFNKREDMLVNGRWMKRYSHLLPANVAGNLITRTSQPYKASEILDFVFGAPTVHTTWLRSYHPAQLSGVVYNVDCAGRKLADIVADLSGRQGLVFTLMGGRYSLVWARKGEGTLPSSFDDFPDQTDDQRLGAALSGRPTQITVLGDRNRYQVMNVPMTPDWNTQWTTSFHYPRFEYDFEEYVFNNLTDPATGKRYNTVDGTDPENIKGHLLATARAETITVGEFADILDAAGFGGEVFRDRRKFNGRTRLDMPVVLYVKLLVFRAYRLPDDFQILNAAGQSMSALQARIVDGNVAEMTYDYVSGVIKAVAMDEATLPVGNGLVIAQGFKFFSPPPAAFASDRFDLTQWQNTTKLWQRAEFHIDDSGGQTQFIIFDDPLASSANLFTEVDGHWVLNGAAAFAPCPVRTALVFEGEPFQRTGGAVGLNAIESVPDLGAQYLMGYGSAAPEEIPYADGQTANEKAQAILDYLLLQQPIYGEGGYTTKGSNGVQLNSVIDRVTVRLNPQGLTEEVYFTNEQTRNSFEPERDFERRLNLLQLAPGQLELRKDARQLKADAAVMRHNPRFTQILAKAFHDRYGSGSDINPVYINTTPANLDVGTPLWKTPTVNTAGKMTNTRAKPPAASTVNDLEFCGVTIADQEAVASTGQTPLQRQGVGLARVMGPASAGDVVAQSAGKTYLVSASVGVSGAPSAGLLLQDVPDSAVHLVKVNFSAAGGGAAAVAPAQGMQYRGDWNADLILADQDVTTVRNGVGAGTFVALEPVAAGGAPPSNGTQYAIISNQDLESVWR